MMTTRSRSGGRLVGIGGLEGRDYWERLEINEQRRVATTTSARGCCCSRSVVRFVSFWP